MGETTGVRRRVVVTGLVQGVGFRYWARREAERLELSGYVRNTASGRVEAEIEGEPEVVARMIEKLYAGPAHARVDDVAVREIPAAGTDGFAIAD